MRYVSHRRLKPRPGHTAGSGLQAEVHTRQSFLESLELAERPLQRTSELVLVSNPSTSTKGSSGPRLLLNDRIVQPLLQLPPAQRDLEALCFAEPSKLSIQHTVRLQFVQLKKFLECSTGSINIGRVTNDRHDLIPVLQSSMKCVQHRQSLLRGSNLFGEGGIGAAHGSSNHAHPVQGTQHGVLGAITTQDWSHRANALQRSR